MMRQDFRPEQDFHRSIIKNFSAVIQTCAGKPARIALKEETGGCGMEGASLGADQVAHLAHLNARGTTLAYASRAPQKDIAPVKARMGWEMPWYTITDSFDVDFGVDQWHGHNVFFRDGEGVFRTYFVNSRGDEAMGTTWGYLDITPLGRQETWGDSPEGYPQTQPYKWWNWHDNYASAASPDPKRVDIITDPQGAAARRRESERS
jgi:predicted dithiol-disulfide oxidoreductase (DUF899 family)